MPRALEWMKLTAAEVQQAARRFPAGRQSGRAQHALACVRMKKHVEQDIADHVAILVRQSGGRHRHKVEQPPEQGVSRASDSRRIHWIVHIVHLDACIAMAAD